MNENYSSIYFFYFLYQTTVHTNGIAKQANTDNKDMNPLNAKIPSPIRSWN